MIKRIRRLHDYKIGKIPYLNQGIIPIRKIMVQTINVKC